MFPATVVPESSHTPPSHEDLTAEVAQVLVENHRRFLGFLERRLGDRALAEDILQDAFVRGVNRLDSLSDKESAVAWFYRILRNSVIDHYRRQSASNRKLERLAQALAAEQAADSELSTSVCQCIARLANTLKPEYAEALRRVELDGLSVKDYAAHAGITSNNAAVRVFRAREVLRQRLSRSCGTCAEHGCLDCTCDMSG